MARDKTWIIPFCLNNILFNPSFEIPICLLATLVFAMMCVWQDGISRVEAIFLLILFIIFISYTIYITRKSQIQENQKGKNNDIKISKNFLFIILGILGLKFGGDLTVNNATNIATILGLSEKLISVTILAIGTSLPELVTSVIAAIRGNSDIAVGNIIGSNIFNILLIIGTSALVRPISYNTSYQMDIIVLLFGTLMLVIFPLIPPKDKMVRREGFLYVLLYVVYIVMSIQK